VKALSCTLDQAIALGYIWAIGVAISCASNGDVAYVHDLRLSPPTLFTWRLTKLTVKRPL